jgi:hypothetical protein
MRLENAPTNTRWVSISVGLLAICVSVALFTVSGGAAKAEPPTWSSGGTTWSGSGTAFMPGGSFVGPPDAPNDPCPDCSWKVISVCNPGDAQCHKLHGCSANSEYSLVFFGRGSATPDLLGAECVGGAPISAQTLGRLVGERVRQVAPEAHIAFQPTSTALTALPTVFRTGQEQTIRRSESIAGIPVDFEATARWQWSWGDGSSPTTTSKPGGRWPDTSVTHTYRKPGKFRVALKATWTATYTVNGRGPLPVTGGPVVMEATLMVPVAQARSLLVSP